MAEVSCNTWGVGHVIEVQGGDEGVHFKKEREGLANASAGAENRDFETGGSATGPGNLHRQQGAGLQREGGMESLLCL